MNTMTSMTRTSTSNPSEILAIYLLSVLAIFFVVNIGIWLYLGVRFAFDVFGRLQPLLTTGILTAYTATRDLFIMLATQLLDVVLRAAGFGRHIFFVATYATIKVLFAFARFVLRRATADRKSTRLNSSHSGESRMPSSA